MPGLALPEAADWPILIHDLRRNLGRTLLRDGQVKAALLAPSLCEAPVQTGAGWVLPLHDAGGHVLKVILDDLPGRAVTALSQLPQRSRVLVEAREDLGRLRFDLVSVLHQGQGLTVWNASLDPPPTWPKQGWLTKAIPWARKVRKGGEAKSGQSLADDLLLAALELGQGQDPAPQLAGRIAACEIPAMGWLLSPPATPAKALRLAWIAAELRGNAEK